MTPEALYVHVDGIEQLPPLLRVYQGAARTLTGDVDDATILKLHRLKPQVSFLVYPTFDKNPQPALQTSIVARLPELRVTFRNFGNSENPPILHRKELFVPESYKGLAKFERLTRQEERAGLLDQPMGNKRGWEEQLRAGRYRTAGHRLVTLE
jgi:DNA phosphorothioation-associated putative methyltransferase